MHDRKRNPLSPPLSCCAAVLRQLQKQQLMPNCHPGIRIEATVRTCYPTRRIWAMLMLMLPPLLYFHIDQIPQWTRHMPCSVKGVRPFFFVSNFLRGISETILMPVSKPVSRSVITFIWIRGRWAVSPVRFQARKSSFWATLQPFCCEDAQKRIKLQLSVYGVLLGTPRI